MPEIENFRVEPTSGPGAPQAARAAREASDPLAAAEARRQALKQEALRTQEHHAAATDGQIRAAYAQFVVEPETNHVRVRILDAATHEVIREIPSEVMEHVSRSLKNYADALARAHAADQGLAAQA